MKKNWYYLRRKYLEPGNLYYFYLAKKYNAKKYLKKLNLCNGIISGRFHVVCFALQNRIPFLALKSNTPKIENILSEIGISNRIINIDHLDDKIILIDEYSDQELINIENYSNCGREKIINTFHDILK